MDNAQKPAQPGDKQASGVSTSKWNVNGRRTNRRRTSDDGRRTTDNGRRMTDDGRRTTDDGRGTTDDGGSMTAGARRAKNGSTPICGPEIFSGELSSRHRRRRYRYWKCGEAWKSLSGARRPQLLRRAAKRTARRQLDKLPPGSLRQEAEVQQALQAEGRGWGRGIGKTGARGGRGGRVSEARRRRSSVLHAARRTRSYADAPPTLLRLCGGRTASNGNSGWGASTGFDSRRWRRPPAAAPAGASPKIRQSEKARHQDISTRSLLRLNDDSACVRGSDLVGNRHDNHSFLRSYYFYNTCSTWQA